MSDITRQKTIDYLYYLKTHYPKKLIIPEYIDYAIASLETDEAYQLEYEPTTKNDLGVNVHDNNVGNIDCISREQAKAAIRNRFKDLPSRVEINTILNELPSVTPQEPFINKPCVSEKVCEHDKQMVLDKIRAEIDNALSDGMIHKKTVIGILDKHISGKEET